MNSVKYLFYLELLNHLFRDMFVSVLECYESIHISWSTNHHPTPSPPTPPPPPPYKQLIYIHISCKCDTNRAGHFTLGAHASRPVACLWQPVPISVCDVTCCCRHRQEGFFLPLGKCVTRFIDAIQLLKMKCPKLPKKNHWRTHISIEQSS